MLVFPPAALFGLWVELVHAGDACTDLLSTPTLADLFGKACRPVGDDGDKVMMGTSGKTHSLAEGGGDKLSMGWGVASASTSRCACRAAWWASPCASTRSRTLWMASSRLVTTGSVVRAALHHTAVAAPLHSMCCNAPSRALKRLFRLAAQSLGHRRCRGGGALLACEVLGDKTLREHTRGGAHTTRRRCVATA